MFVINQRGECLHGLHFKKVLILRSMFLDAIKQKVAYVHGKAFHVDDGGERSMRLNFSYSTDEQIDEGMKRLGNVIKKKLEKK